MRTLSLILIPILAFACQEISDDECPSAILIGSQNDCQLLGDDRDLLLLLINQSDTVLALYPSGVEVSEAGASISIQYSQVSPDSLVCKAIVSPKPLIEITSLNCN
ncbi:MAG: hypothetical protein RIC35_22585 [Marinoscillum sp.]